MQDEYLYVITMLFSLNKMLLVWYTLDGVTNIKVKSLINFMTCSSITMFLKQFSIKLCRKSEINFLEKICCKLRLFRNIYILILSYLVILKNNLMKKNYFSSRINILLIHQRFTYAMIHQASWVNYAKNVLNWTSSWLTTFMDWIQSTNFASICANSLWNE